MQILDVPIPLSDDPLKLQRIERSVPPRVWRSCPLAWICVRVLQHWLRTIKFDLWGFWVGDVEVELQDEQAVRDANTEHMNKMEAMTDIRSTSSRAAGRRSGA